MHDPPQTAHRRVVALATRLVPQREVLVPESEVRPDSARLVDDPPLELGGQRVPHVDHRPVDSVLARVVRQNPRDTIPQRGDGSLRLGEPRVVHAHGVVRDVVEVRVVVQPQVGDIRPRGLRVVRRPVGERPRNARLDASGRDADVADAIKTDRCGRGSRDVQARDRRREEEAARGGRRARHVP